MKHLTPEQFSAYLDNELRGKALEEAKDHLASCNECRLELTQLAALEKLTREAEPETVEETHFQAFSSRVMEGIAREKPVPLGESFREWFKKLNTIPVFRLQWMGGVAVAALVIGFGIYIYKRPELVRLPYKPAPPSVVERKNVETPPSPVATATPSVSGAFRAPALEGGRTEATRPDRGAGGLGGKVTEVKQPVTLAAKAPKTGTGSTGVPLEKTAPDKSLGATVNSEVAREEAKKEKTEDLKARPEGYTPAPEPGARGAVRAKEAERLAGMASPSLRAQTGEKQEADEVLFADAQAKQSSQAYRDAAKVYDSLVQYYPKSLRYDDAQYNLALSEYANSQQTRKPRDLKRALTVSKAFLKAAQDSTRKAQVARQVVVLEKQLKAIK